MILPDKLFIKNLRTRCIVGINKEEREKKQDVILNLELFADLSRPCKSDDIEETVNYSLLKKEILHLVENSSYLLIEKLAEEVAGLCLGNPEVQAVRVGLEKPTALRFADSVGVEIYREKK